MSVNDDDFWTKTGDFHRHTLAIAMDVFGKKTKKNIFIFIQSLGFFGICYVKCDSLYILWQQQKLNKANKATITSKTTHKRNAIPSFYLRNFAVIGQLVKFDWLIMQNPM